MSYVMQAKPAKGSSIKPTVKPLVEAILPLPPLSRTAQAGPIVLVIIKIHNQQCSDRNERLIAQEE